MNYLQEMMYRRAEAEYERARDEACCGCEPEIIKAERAYEPDGYSMDYTYNCHICDNRECEYWSDYNHEEDDEI